jgi:hypothetical protein
MKLIKQYGLIIGAALILLFNLAACGPTTVNGTASVTLDEQHVTTILQNMLNGYNSGDYEAFSKDLSPEMKAVISKDLFDSFHTQSQATLGQFKSISSIKQTESADGNITWTVSAVFEKTTQQFTVTFNQATGQITGMDLIKTP